MNKDFDGAGVENFQAKLTEVENEKTFFVCQKHFYTPGPNRMPHSGCSDCWRALYWTMYAKMDPAERDAWVEGLEAAIYHSTEMVEKGTWDFDIDRKAHIEIDLDAAPDDSEIEIELTDPN